MHGQNNPKVDLHFLASKLLHFLNTNRLTSCGWRSLWTMNQMNQVNDAHEWCLKVVKHSPKLTWHLPRTPYQNEIHLPTTCVSGAILIFKGIRCVYNFKNRYRWPSCTTSTRDVWEFFCKNSFGVFFFWGNAMIFGLLHSFKTWSQVTTRTTHIYISWEIKDTNYIVYTLVYDVNDGVALMFLFGSKQTTATTAIPCYQFFHRVIGLRCSRCLQWDGQTRKDIVMKKLKLPFLP